MGRHVERPGSRLRAGTWAELTSRAMRDTGLTEQQIRAVLVRLAELSSGTNTRQGAST